MLIVDENDVPHRLSWWPPVDVWELCGLNRRMWTPDAEEWFQRRLRGIHEGTQSVLTRSQWVQALAQYSCEARVEIDKINDAFSARMVDALYPSMAKSS